MKKSIRAKLTLLVAVIIVLVIIVQLGFDLSYAEDYFIQEKSSQIEKFYDKLKEAIADNDVDQISSQRETDFWAKYEDFYLCGNDRDDRGMDCRQKIYKTDS